MKLTLKTPIPKNYKVVMDGFDKNLFEFLKPIGAKMEIVEFTGSETGDTVHIRFLKPIKAEWVSDITDHGINEQEAFFLDEGRILPKPLSKWKHRHVVKNINLNKSVIEDQIEFQTGNVILDIILYPFMFMGFFPRKFQYKKYFK
ncbi:SRPBCC family protein [Portibacter lacus]|uniref:Ligand-binding SRPBCC domain-containing protein n=1 Tax=Portibacter lacus TaxID=1099794 RepID=A0AA37SUT1_9BACT|nr:hypothetical protein [Portibacter lacus]GLR20169.1 hypothetical protein GCM10007940_47850 [Portibacter lacus]